MIEFQGGPADGRTLDFQRLPTYLRVVTAPTLLDQAAGLDVLDQLDDQPEPHEHVSVYRLTARDPSIHVNMRPGHRWIHVARYEWIDVDGEPLRSTDAWRAWALGQPDTDPAPMSPPDTAI